MATRDLKLIVTLGPATWSEENLRKIKDKGVDLVRINMSHSSVEDLSSVLKSAKALDLPFIVDTEGSQLRTGRLPGNIHLEAGSSIRLYLEDVMGDELGVTIKPDRVVEQLQIGDLLFVGFDTLVLRVTSAQPLVDGHVLADVISAGTLNQNKAVVVVTASQREIIPPVLTEKDYQSITLGLEQGAEYIALSYARRGDDVDVVRRATGNAMGIISKIEAWEGVEKFDEIAMNSDYLLLDRGDMSKEVPIEQIPIIQKDLIARARALHVPIYVATNFLESMVTEPKPTRAEANDVINTIFDGADGLILSAETAVGAYPFECINMMKRLMARASIDTPAESRPVVDNFDSLGLVPSHGGPLVDGFSSAYSFGVEKLRNVQISDETLSDLKQIATGAFSPLRGFMTQADFSSVIDRMRLANDVVWPIPIVLDLTEEAAENIEIGDDVHLCTESGTAVGLLRVEDVYRLDKDFVVQKLTQSHEPADASIEKIANMRPVLLGGAVQLSRYALSSQGVYEMTPRQMRRVFENRGWSKIARLEDSDLTYLGDESLHRFVLREQYCDGLFIQLNAGKGNVASDKVADAYQSAMRSDEGAGRIVFGLSAAASRGYGEFRETILRAIVGKNFGCSHVVVDRSPLSEGAYSPHLIRVVADMGVAFMATGSARNGDVASR
jgi:pyruvate kinase